MSSLPRSTRRTSAALVNASSPPGSMLLSEAQALGVASCDVLLLELLAVCRSVSPADLPSPMSPRPLVRPRHAAKPCLLVQAKQQLAELQAQVALHQQQLQQAELQAAQHRGRDEASQALVQELQAELSHTQHQLASAHHAHHREQVRAYWRDACAGSCAQLLPRHVPAFIPSLQKAVCSCLFASWEPSTHTNNSCA